MSARRIAAQGAALVVSLFAGVTAQAGDLPAAVQATHPIAYYRLGDVKGKSEAGASEYQATGGAAVSEQGGQFAGPTNAFLILDGKTGLIETTQLGGIPGAGSLMAWVNFAALPSADHHFYYVGGESQSGNDFDLQFEDDNQLKFYTASGGHITYVPAPDTLVNHWHMIVVTVDGKSGERHIYWDGASVATDQGAKGMAPKKSELSFGESKVFTGRHLHGGVDEMALWDHALSAAEVASIYAAADKSALAATLSAAPITAVATAGFAGVCAGKPASTNPKNLHDITPPAYLAFLPSAISVGGAEYHAWDQQPFPQWGGTGGSEELKRGKHWYFYGALVGTCTDKQQAWAALAPAFQKAGWTLVKKYDGQPLLLLLHYTQSGIDAWANVRIGQPPGMDMDAVEVTPLPVHMTLAAPAAAPETVDPAKGDFPYLAPIPGSHFKGGGHGDRPMYVPQPAPQPDELVASGETIKSYDPPSGFSNLEFVSVYHEALENAGWSIVKEFNSADAAVTTHYGKNGRNIWAYLHINGGGYDITVGDEGRLETALTQQCHVALTGLLFDFNKATLKPESDGVLQAVLGLLNKTPALKLEIQGHTDNVGNDQYNQTLSEQRAAAVVTWLSQHGIAAGRLSSSGFGRTRPVADNKTDEGRAKNRRVEIVNPACKAKGN